MWNFYDIISTGWTCKWEDTSFLHEIFDNIKIKELLYTTVWLIYY